MKLKYGQLVYFKGEKYFVKSQRIIDKGRLQQIEVKLNKVVGEGDLKFLIEQEHGKTRYLVSEPYSRSVHVEDDNIEYYGEIFNLRDRFSNRETVEEKSSIYEYADYVSEDGTKIISYLYEYGRDEVAMLNYIDPFDIKITRRIDPSVKDAYKEFIKTLILSFAIMLIGLIGMLLFINIKENILPKSKSMIKYFEKDNYYELVTEIKNEENNSKAKVFKSKFMDEDTCTKDIITNLNKSIIKVNNSESVKGVAVETKYEYAYIYFEEDTVFVQVSKKEFPKAKNGVTVYHNNHLNGYLAGFRYQSTSSYYSNYMNEVLKQSIY